MKIMIDTNVILDHLLDRLPFSNYAGKIINLSEDGELTGVINASSATDIYYILRKFIGHERAIEVLNTLLLILDVSEVNKSDLLSAMEINMSDYEDALVACCAKRIKAEYIVTRNIKDFLSSPVQPISPGDFITRFFPE